MKRICVLIALLLASTVALAQNGIVYGYCNLGATSAVTSGLPSTNKLQGIIPVCTVSVFFSGTATLVPGSQIYSDLTGTVLGNPFSANTLGAWQFFASILNAYDVQLSGGMPPNQYIIPQTITGLIPASMSSATPITALGCVPNSTTNAVMTANVTCLQKAGNAGGHYYMPGTVTAPQVFNINSCVNITSNGGFILEGAGIASTSIIQNTSGTCAFELTNAVTNEFVFKYMTIGHSTIQTAPASKTVDSVAPAILLAGTTGATFFRFEMDHVAFTKSSRGVDLLKGGVSRTAWDYKFRFINGNSDLQGATINLIQGGSGGNPRCHFEQIFSTQNASEPLVSASTCAELFASGLEFTPAVAPAAAAGNNTGADFSGTQNGTVDGAHFEKYYVSTAGIPLITAENSNILFKNVDASLSVCVTGSSCAGATNPAVYLISNVAGGGTVTLEDAQMSTPYGDSNSTTQLYGVRYHSNPVSVSITKFTAVPPSGGGSAPIEPASDLGLATNVNAQFADTTLNGSAGIFTLTSVANTSGGAQVYTGTITGGTGNAYAGAWFLVSGFSTSGNNGFFRCTLSTSTTLTLVNTAGSAESAAATATESVGSVAHNIYQRYQNSGSVLSYWSYQPMPVWNPVSSAYDSYLNYTNTGMMTGGLNFFSPGITHIWLKPNPNLSVINCGTVGYMRFWTHDTTNYSTPDLDLARNDGTGCHFVHTIIRGDQDGGGYAELSVLVQTNTGQSPGNEVYPATPQFRVDKSGNVYLNGTSTLPGTAGGNTGVNTGLVSLVPAAEAFGFTTLVSGVSPTISNAAACTPSATCVYKVLNVGLNASTATGCYGVTNVSAGVSFKVTAFTCGAVTTQTGDLSSLSWQIN